MIATKTISGVLATTGGATAMMLGKMAGFSAGDWALLVAVVALVTTAASLGRYGHITSKTDMTPDREKREWRRACFMLGLQIAAGVGVAIGLKGELIYVIPACCTIGWMGPRYFSKLERLGGADSREKDGE